MADDRIYRWDPGVPEAERPTIEDVYDALLDYFHVEECWEMLSRSSYRIFVTLPGNNQKLAAWEEPPEPRAFEVYVDETHVDVITRMQDHYTNAVADGFYRHLVTRRWKGHAE